MLPAKTEQQTELWPKRGDSQRYWGSSSFICLPPLDARVQQMSCLQTALSRFVSKLSLVSIKLYNTLPDFYLFFFFSTTISSSQWYRQQAFDRQSRPGICLYMPRHCLAALRFEVWGLGQAIVLPFAKLKRQANVGGRMRKLTRDAVRWVH